MKRDRTLGLLAIALAAALTLVFLDRRRPTTDETAHVRGRILPEFSRAQASAITIERRDGKKIELRHEASGWWLATPRRRADDATVESLLTVLELGQVERRIGGADQSTRQTFGLAPPVAVVRVGGRTLRVGGDSPGRGVYLLRDDGPEVLVAEHRLIEVVDLDPALWRSLRPTLGDPTEAARFAFGDWSLARDRGWRVTSPAVARAADGKVDALLQSLLRARASSELDVAAPAGGVALGLDGHEDARLGGACPHVAASLELARADGAVLCFNAADFDTLRAPVTTLYERRLFPLRVDDVRALDVTTAGRLLSLRRENGTWRILAPGSDGGLASDDKVRALVQRLVDVEARAFSPEAPRAPLVRVRLAGADDDLTVELGAAGGVALARRAGETVSLEIDAALLTALDASGASQLRASDGGAR